MQTVQRLHSTNSDQRRDNLAEWHGVHTVLPATHTFIHEWNGIMGFNVPLDTL